MLLVGCANSTRDPSPSPLAAMGFQLFEAASSAEALRRFLADTTVRTYSEAYGTQIEYFAESGKTYLLVPEKSQIVVGEWKTQTPEAGGQAEICLRYGKDAFDPVTAAQFRDWNCRLAYGLFKPMKEVAYGNPLGLREGPVPVVLPKTGDIPMSRVSSLAGRNGEIRHKWQ